MIVTTSPDHIAKVAIERFLQEIEDHGYGDDLAMELAIEHVRGVFEGGHFVTDAACCGAEPEIKERHSSDCEHRPRRTHDCVVCDAMRAAGQTPVHPDPR